MLGRSSNICFYLCGVCLFESGCAIYDRSILENAEQRGQIDQPDVSSPAIAGFRGRDLPQIQQLPRNPASASQNTSAPVTPLQPPGSPGAQAAGSFASAFVEDDAGVEVTSSPRDMQDAAPPRPVARASPACRGRTGYVSPSDGRCYFVVAERMSWHTARDECLRINAHLATVTNEREQAFVASFEQETETWLGLSRFGAAHFSWITNEEFAFMSWEQGAPRERPESGVVILPDTGLWSDRHPMDRYPALCETKPRDE